MERRRGCRWGCARRLGEGEHGELDEGEADEAGLVLGLSMQILVALLIVAALAFAVLAICGYLDPE